MIYISMSKLGQELLNKYNSVNNTNEGSFLWHSEEDSSKEAIAACYTMASSTGLLTLTT